jgi:hypothetical protein
VPGWSLGLQIVSEGVVTGSLMFATATLPSNYVFAGDSGWLSPVSLPSSSIFIFDTTNDNGVIVPANGTNLLALTFTAAAGTSGKFAIQALGDPNTGSNWTAYGNGTFPTTAFGNVPFGSNPVSLGEVTVGQVASVPEPQSAVLLISGLVSLLAYGHVRRRRR